ncbi:MAG: hypothetical protein FJ095_12845 [Deltaproteobacteria bacterium]|nr:hypothetical protein [Deltaproteobacteria bacterium]
MRRTLGLYAVWSSIFALAACAEEPGSLGFVMRTSSGLLDTASAVELRVSEGAACDPASGRVTNEVDPDTFALDRCDGGSWCKTIKLDKDGSTRVFHVLATNAGTEVAEGCARATLDKDPLEVAIQVKPFIAPACCNDGKLQATEQCDTGLPSPTDCAGNALPKGEDTCVSILADAVCECDCLAKELVLSVPGTMPTTTNDPGTKSELSLVFLGGTALRAAYTDSQGVGGAPDINIRSLTPDFLTITDPPSLSKQLRLPAECSIVLTNGIPREQRAASIAQVSATTTAIAYADSKAQAQRFDISLVAHDATGCANVAPVKVNKTAPEICSDAAACNGFPDVAGGPDGTALVVWNYGGQLLGRLWKTNGDLVPADTDIALGPMSEVGKPRVAGSSSGWVVAYPGGEKDNVYVTRVDTSGAVQGSPKRVNVADDGEQDQPDVAMQPDGRSVVVWRSGASIFFQRFDAMGNEVSSDQDSALSREAPDAAALAMPVVASGGDWFAAAWTAADGTVWARYIGKASGFGFNNVNGQNGPFPATHPAIKHQRSNPAIAIGKFVAIGWQDPDPSDPHGVIVRRLPLPRLN